MTLLLKLRGLVREDGRAGELSSPAARPVSPVAVAPDSLPAAAAADPMDERRVAALLRPRTGHVQVMPR